MIKAISEGNSTSVEIKGGVKDLIRETGSIIHAIYEALTEVDPILGKAYKEFVLDLDETDAFKLKDKKDEDDKDDKDKKDDDDDGDDLDFEELNHLLDELIKKLRKSV